MRPKALADVGRARYDRGAVKRKPANPVAEDYLERIFDLVEEKGYARVADIAALLDVSSPSVTRMVQKLAKEGYLKYEKYRGLVLTSSGTALGRSVKEKHRSLEEFLRLIGVTDTRTIWRDVEGIEHHVSPSTMRAIRSLIRFFEASPELRARLAAFRRQDQRD
jgi:Mn-dependent DtxR family transcriptional regulator